LKTSVRRNVFIFRTIDRAGGREALFYRIVDVILFYPFISWLAPSEKAFT